MRLENGTPYHPSELLHSDSITRHYCNLWCLHYRKKYEASSVKSFAIYWQLIRTMGRLCLIESSDTTNIRSLPSFVFPNNTNQHSFVTRSGAQDRSHQHLKLPTNYKGLISPNTLIWQVFHTIHSLPFECKCCTWMRKMNAKRNWRRTKVNLDITVIHRVIHTKNPASTYLLRQAQQTVTSPITEHRTSTSTLTGTRHKDSAIGETA